MKERLDSISTAIAEAGAIELLADLVRSPSHHGVERQEEGVVDRLAHYLISRGLDLGLVEVAPGRPNLLCTVSGINPGRHLLLCGHTDTVPLNVSDPGVGFSAEIRDGSMFGRGTADMKGGIAAMVAALVALHETEALEAGAVSLAAVVDEEMESIGAEHLVRSGIVADGAIIGEPTDNRLALGHKGLEWIEIGFTGKAAHGSMPQAGINAIVAASRFVQHVQDHLIPRLHGRSHPLLGAPSINFGTIRGGDQPSTVAATCLLSADRRSVPGEVADAIFAELREILAVVESEMPGLTTSVRRFPGGMATMEHVACVIDADHPLARASMKACEAVKGGPERGGAFAAWTDGALLSAYAGIPSVVLGPGALELAHSPAECVALEQVLEAARIYAAAALMFCEPESRPS